MRVQIIIDKDLPDEEQNLTVILYTKNFESNNPSRYEYKSTLPKEQLISIKVIEGAINYLINQFESDLTIFLDNLRMKNKPKFNKFMESENDENLNEIAL